jgi:hypothetical protein
MDTFLVVFCYEDARPNNGSGFSRVHRRRGDYRQCDPEVAGTLRSALPFSRDCSEHHHTVLIKTVL